MPAEPIWCPRAPMSLALPLLTAKPCPAPSLLKSLICSPRRRSPRTACSVSTASERRSTRYCSRCGAPALSTVAAHPNDPLSDRPASRLQSSSYARPRLEKEGPSDQCSKKHGHRTFGRYLGDYTRGQRRSNDCFRDCSDSCTTLRRCSLRLYSEDSRP